MFDWDDANRKHVADQGVTPSEAEEIIANDPLDLELQLINGEERLLQIGETNALRVLVVVTTWRGQQDSCRDRVSGHPAIAGVLCRASRIER